MVSHQQTSSLQIHSCVPKYYHQPSSIDEIVDIVNFARARNEKIRVVGASHSPSDIGELITLKQSSKRSPTNIRIVAKVSERDHMMNLDRFNKILGVDGATGLVKVQAGIRIRDINEVGGLHLIITINHNSNHHMYARVGTIETQSTTCSVSSGIHFRSITRGSYKHFDSWHWNELRITLVLR